jgi:two-component system sensor histidine kinase KdpD
MTPVHIRHLEIVNDAVARTTGVRVRETVPDTSLHRTYAVIDVGLT